MQPQFTAEKPACWPALLSVIAAVHSSLTVGYAYGYTSTALKQLNDLPDGYAFRLGSISADLFVIFLSVAGFLSCLLSGMISDKFGRKKTLLLSGIPNAAGWILNAISPYVTPAGPIVFKGIILTGRLLTGVACGSIYSAILVYASEVALPKQRGFIGTVPLLFIMIGVSLSYAVGAVLSYDQSAIIATGFVFTYLILTATVPESPRWLVVKGHKSSAVDVLQWLRRSHQFAEKEAGEIKKVIENTPKLTLKKQVYDLRRRYVYLPLLICLFLTFFQQVAGQQVLNFFSSIILENAGVSNPEATAIYSIGLAQIFGIILSCVLVDRVGRKPLLILGGLGTGIACGLLGTHFYLTRPSLCQSAGGGEITFNTSIAIAWNNTFNETTTVDSSCNPEYAPLAICSLVLFSLAYSLGYLCVVHIMKTELTPLYVRGLVVSLVDCFGWVLLITVTGSYNNYEQAVQPYTAWWSFAAVCFSGALFVLVFIPETKGSTLEDIEVLFRSKQFCCTKEMQKNFDLAQGKQETECKQMFVCLCCVDPNRM